MSSTSNLYFSIIYILLAVQHISARKERSKNSNTDREGERMERATFMRNCIAGKLVAVAGSKAFIRMHVYIRVYMSKKDRE